MNKEVKQLWNTAVEVGIFVLVLWGIFFIDAVIPYDFCQWGIQPRSARGLVGIFTSPFLHGSLKHIASNSVPVFVLLMTLVTFYRQRAAVAVIGIAVIGGGLVWLLGRSASHVGISGLIYGLTTFLIAAGIFQKKFKSIVISIVVVVVYGGIMWGVMPGQYWISWEGHLFGAVAGVMMAYVLFKGKR